MPYFLAKLTFFARFYTTKRLLFINKLVLFKPAYTSNHRNISCVFPIHALWTGLALCVYKMDSGLVLHELHIIKEGCRHQQHHQRHTPAFLHICMAVPVYLHCTAWYITAAINKTSYSVVKRIPNLFYPLLSLSAHYNLIYLTYCFIFYSFNIQAHL